MLEGVGCRIAARGREALKKETAACYTHARITPQRLKGSNWASMRMGLDLVAISRAPGGNEPERLFMKEMTARRLEDRIR